MQKGLMMNISVAAVDIFCGIGGLTHGLIKAGIPVVAGIDIDQTCKYAFEKNNDSNYNSYNNIKLFSNLPFPIFQ